MRWIHRNDIKYGFVCKLNEYLDQAMEYEGPDFETAKAIRWNKENLIIFCNIKTITSMNEVKQGQANSLCNL